MHLQAVLLCVQRPEYARHCNFAVLVLLVGMQSQSLRTSRNRDGCALLRSAERAFCKNAKPASARYRTTGLGCVQQALARQGSLYIQRHCLQELVGRSPNPAFCIRWMQAAHLCQMLFQHSAGVRSHHGSVMFTGIGIAPQQAEHARQICNAVRVLAFVRTKALLADAN